MFGVVGVVGFDTGWVGGAAACVGGLDGVLGVVAGGGELGAGVGGGLLAGGVGRGVLGAGFGFCGVCVTGAEARPGDVRSSGRATARLATRRSAAGLATGLRSGIRTTGGDGAGSTTRGVAATRTSRGDVDSNAARQRYPDVTPAATSAQSRSASNEIRTRMSIGLLPDSIGADIPLR